MEKFFEQPRTKLGHFFTIFATPEECVGLLKGYIDAGLTTIIARIASDDVRGQARMLLTKSNRNWYLNMEPLSLTLSCNEYDRTRFLVDGTVKAEGIDLNIVSLPSEERHRRFSRDLEFDVCELQMGVFLGWMGRGAPFTAIPVFPHRKFCHGNVLVAYCERYSETRGLRRENYRHARPLQSGIASGCAACCRKNTACRRARCRIRTNQQEQVPGWQPPDWMEIRAFAEGTKNRRRLASR